MRTMLVTVVVLGLATFGLASTASACTQTPVVTIGSTTFPADGLWVWQDCFQGSAHISADTPVSAGSVCEDVPPVFVIGVGQVPGTGQPVCTPPVDASHAEAPPVTAPDVTVIVCAAAPTVGFCLVTVGSQSVVALCTGGFLDIATIAPGVRTDCTWF